MIAPPLSRNKNEGYTTLRVWGLTQYEHVVYIDADTLITECIDEARKRATAAAVGQYGCQSQLIHPVEVISESQNDCDNFTCTFVFIT